MSAPSNPIEAAFAATPSWMLAIRNFDAIEVHPCCVVGFADGHEIVETCEPEDAHFWSVYGRLWPLRDGRRRLLRGLPDRSRGGSLCRKAPAHVPASCRRLTLLTRAQLAQLLDNGRRQAAVHRLRGAATGLD
jgi:hypothetical protein